MSSPNPNLSKVESKLVVASVLATLLYGVLEIVQENTSVLAFLPPVGQEIAQALIPGLLAFLAGYRITSNRV